jgi:thiosulfate/3-mercaptopyruvate sulfurtransferase
MPYYLIWRETFKKLPHLIKILLKTKGGKMHLSKKIVIGVVSLLFVISLVAGYQNAYAGAGPLVETKWVKDNMANVKPVYVGTEVENDMKKYEGEHIAGSAYMPMCELMGAIMGSGTPDKAKFESLMGKLGVSNDSHVVLYSTPAANPFIPGAYWLMKYFGHTNVSILNGSLDKWKRDGHSVISNAENISPTTYTASAGNASIFADGAYVLKNLKNEKVAIVDSRGSDEYTGQKKVSYIKRAGHIPGAINLNFYPTHRNNDGSYKSVADIKKAYEAAGVTMDKEVVAYCEGQPRAADAYFVLKELSGYQNVKVYVGSWMDWGNNEQYPVEK